ncbi:hypothetical protein RFI_22640 [Reticulomyxa filosa]|uniref:SAP domain-containing protein n=1 Tax=Reticulomyxa filosa TaxID=46433 RepID=X6MLG5_RETFI|nr:hypothetical protein RFI_22640 [Reticulomyxa filosa]|eukprot:ETO14729.1 hypothetical protein RFI_22640 [Reticulomyxa filosa]
MHVIFLPYADDIRKVPLASNAPRATSQPQLITKAKKVIDALQFGTVPQPSNPALQRHFDALQALALDEEPPELKDELLPDLPGIEEVAGNAITDLMNSLPESMSLDVKPSIVLVGKKRKNEVFFYKKKKKEEICVLCECWLTEAGGRKRKTARKNENEDAATAATFDWKKMAENDELKNLKIDDLKIYLANNCLKKTGKKAELIARIVQHLGLS